MKKRLYASDFGAVGDGVRDDGPAICEAVKAAIAENAELLFDENKTYYVGTSPSRAVVFDTPFAFEHAHNVTVDGQGAVFLMAPGINYFVMHACSDVTLKNCRFDYAETVYLVGRVKAADGCKVTFDTDLEPYADSFDYSKYVAFSILYNEGLQRRPHRFLSAMEKTGSREVLVTYNEDPKYEAGDVVYLPNPGIGHVFSEVIYVAGNTSAMTFENVKIHAAPSFTFVMRSNSAEIVLDGVDFMPREDDGREIKMVSWRDGFHVKDNRGAFHWKNCRVGVLYDDVYNISNTLGVVKGFAEDGRMLAGNYEYQCMGRDIPFDGEAGDEVDFYDLRDGKYHGRAVIDAVEYVGGETFLTFRDTTVPTADIPVGCMIGNRMTCAPGSTITDCEFEGTFRFLRDITIENTFFHLLESWMMVEGCVEGPLPGNIEYRNCTFRRGNIQVDAYHRGTGEYMPDIGKEIKNLRAVNCRFEEGVRFPAQTGGFLEIVSED